MQLHELFWETYQSGCTAARAAHCAIALCRLQKLDVRSPVRFCRSVCAAAASPAQIAVSPFAE